MTYITNYREPDLPNVILSPKQKRAKPNQPNKKYCTKGEGEILGWVLPKSALLPLLRKSIVDFKLIISDCTKGITSSAPSESSDSPIGKGSKVELGTVVQAFIPSALEAEASRSSEFKVSLVYLVISDSQSYL